MATDSGAARGRYGSRANQRAGRNLHFSEINRAYNSNDSSKKVKTGPCRKIETCGRTKIRVREKSQQVPERHEGGKAG